MKILPVQFQAPVLALIAALFIGISRPVRAQLYTVEGHASRQIFTGQAWEYRFAVTVSNCAWGIEILQTSPPKTDKDFVRHRQAFDGQTLVSYWYEQSGKRTDARGFVRIDENSVVNAAGMAPVNLIWLAYASRCLFERAKPGHLPDLSESQSLADRKPDVQRRASWELAEGSPRLPKWVHLYYDYETISPSLRPKRSDTESLLYLSYSASAFTNASGISLPLAFKAEIFAVHSDQQKPRLTSGTVQARIDSYRPSVRADLLDVNENGAWLVNDVRFADGYDEGLVVYKATDSLPLDTRTEAMRQVKAKAQSQIAYAKLQQRKTEAHKLPVRTIFIVMALLITGVFAMKFRRIHS